MLGGIEKAESSPQNTEPVTLDVLLELAFDKGLQVRNPILKNIYILISSYLSFGVNQGNYWSGTTKSGLKVTLEDKTTHFNFLLDELYR
ncbi:hypothetical protein KSS87_006786, partial [Heliosperma pusillum]